ncbi:MAG: ABC transporter permease [Anaerolineae bacterium]|nr:ABC transporter permease [Phycisphaerae bacterium]
MNFVRNLILFPVLLYQSLILALAQIRASKMRSMLTTIGIVIGVASVTTVIAALTGLKTNVLSEFETFGTNKVFIFPSRPDRGPMRNASPAIIRFRPPLFDGLLEHSPSLKSFTRLTSVNANVTHGDRTVEQVNIAGIEPAWHEIENRSVQLGRPFSLIDNQQARPVCLINEKLRDKLGLERDCAGDFVMINGRRYLIVGVMETRTESSMFRDGVSDSEVFVPFNTAWRSQSGRAIPPMMYVVAASRSPEVSEEAQAEATFYLRKQRKIAPGAEDTFRVEFVGKFIEQFKSVAYGITAVATGIVGISLLVGGVGIMNIMLVSVSERTREIGLRKAVGARPAAIMLQFLVEAVMLCLVGGLIGVVIGEGLTKGIAAIPGAQLEKAFVPAWAIALSFGFSAVVGLVFGMFPAIKAARLDPIDALRHE